jgi:hypothetical protein
MTAVMILGSSYHSVEATSLGTGKLAVLLSIKAYI